MARFTLRVSLRAFSPEARSGVKVYVDTRPDKYPVSGIGILDNVAPVTTNSEGIADFDLISLPGLVYTVSAKGETLGTVSGADRVDGTIVRLDEVTPVVPSPILPVDAAALRAELLALITAIEVGSVSWSTLTGKPSTFPPAAHAHAEYALQTALTSGLAAKADAAHTHAQYQTASQVASAVTAAIATWVGDAPAALDTLREIADRLDDDTDVIAALTATVGTKASAADLATLVDVVAGKASAFSVATLAGRVTALEAAPPSSGGSIPSDVDGVPYVTIGG